MMVSPKPLKKKTNKLVTFLKVMIGILTILFGGFMFLLQEKWIRQFSPNDSSLFGVSDTPPPPKRVPRRPILPPTNNHDHPPNGLTTVNLPTTTTTKVSYATPLAYGTRGGGIQTYQYVCDAIVLGYRHIVTGGHHQAHNETGVGVGWKLAQQQQQQQQQQQLKRSDLFLQTMFVPWDNTHDFQSQPNDPPSRPSMEEQVHISIQQSLRNLQTHYIDAVIFHNFRAKLIPYEQMLRGWRVLEEYVLHQNQTIRYLGISNVHHHIYFQRLVNDSRIPPTLLQNRFHKNRRYDVPLHSTLLQLSSQIQSKLQTLSNTTNHYHHLPALQVQRFWVLTGNGGGKKNIQMANQKNLTSAQLMIAFVMTLGAGGSGYQSTVLVGPHKKEHMKDDLEIMNRYKNNDFIFQDMDGQDSDRRKFAKNIGMTYPLV